MISIGPTTHDLTLKVFIRTQQNLESEPGCGTDQASDVDHHDEQLIVLVGNGQLDLSELRSCSWRPQHLCNAHATGSVCYHGDHMDPSNPGAERERTCRFAAASCGSFVSGQRVEERVDQITLKTHTHDV